MEINENRKITPQAERARKEFGKQGEEAAASFLEERGYRIVCRNFTCRAGEIDLIAEKPGLLVFCEVKSRGSLAYGMPREAVHAHKIRKIRRVAEWYLVQNGRLSPLPDRLDIRFDVIEVRRTNEGFGLRHIEGAFS
ncbi:MAG: YraN family protein [Clostridiales bacterium]|nr:YraN family protein [Clostridiales bacterium]